MKIQNSSIGLLALLVLSMICYSQTNKKGKLMLIPDYRNQAATPDSTALHKNGDVQIYRTYFMGNCYRIKYYHDYSGKLQMYGAYFGADEAFDQAYYQWLNDTTVFVRLINSETGLRDSVEVYGNNGRSGMRYD